MKRLIVVLWSVLVMLVAAVISFSMVSCTQPTTYSAYVNIANLVDSNVTFTVDGQEKTAYGISLVEFTVTWAGDLNNGDTIGKDVAISANGINDTVFLLNGDAESYKFNGLWFAKN
jgi:uncharacterized lipoprotein YehR (DUF1307 family)